MADWATRSVGTGVFRAFKFDSNTERGLEFNASRPWGWNYASDGVTIPVIDTSIKPGGTGSLKFDVPSNSSGNAAGSWQCRFSNDDLLTFGANQGFYAQVRIRWSQAMMDTTFQAYGGGNITGIKFFDVATGGPDRYGVGGNFLTGSSSNCKAVVQTRPEPAKFPIMYGYVDGNNVGYEQPLAYPDTVSFQNGIDTGGSSGPYCRYTNFWAGPQLPNSCMYMRANEWVTFKIYIGMGSKRADYSNWKWDQTVKLWMAYEDQPSIKLIDYNPTMPGYQPRDCGNPADDEKIGRLTLFPYMTNKDSAQVHTAATVHYDELILSLNDIADPSGTNGATSPTHKSRVRKV